MILSAALALAQTALRAAGRRPLRIFSVGRKLWWRLCDANRRHVRMRIKAAGAALAVAQTALKSRGPPPVADFQCGKEALVAPL